MLDESDVFVDRFNKILDYLDITPYKLAREIDSSDSVLSSIRSGNTKPSFDFLNKLLSKYDVLNGDWLISGKGEMLKKRGYATPGSSSDAMILKEPEMIYGHSARKAGSAGECNQCQDKERIITQQAKTIEVLEESLRIMRDRITDLQKTHS